MKNIAWTTAFMMVSVWTMRFGFSKIVGTTRSSPVIVSNLVSWHNPSNVGKSELGEGWRFLVSTSEKFDSRSEFWNPIIGRWVWPRDSGFYIDRFTYRVPTDDRVIPRVPKNFWGFDGYTNDSGKFITADEMVYQAFRKTN